MCLQGASQTSYFSLCPWAFHTVSVLLLPKAAAVPPFKLPWLKGSPFHVTARGPG